MEGNVSATAIRKAAVTLVHEKESNMAEDLANLMAHNVSTAKKHYRLVEKKKVAAKTSQKLAKMIRHTNDAEESDSMKDSKRSAKSDTVSKHTFTDEQLSEIRRVFKFEIVTKDVSMDTVKAKVQTNYALENCNPRRVYDKIRSEWKVSSRSMMLERKLPREKEKLMDKIERMGDDSTNTISPTEQSFSQPHAIFKPPQLRLLRSIFAGMIEGCSPISMKEIQETIQTHPVASKELCNFKINQLVNRLKFERRIYLKSKM